MRDAVTFRWAWTWVAMWIAFDVIMFLARDHLPDWLGTKDLAKALDKDFNIAWFLLGLWVFERVSIPDPRT